MGNADPKTQNQEKKYEVKPQYEEPSKQQIMQHAINQSYEMHEANKESVLKTSVSTGKSSHVEPPYHGVSTGKSSVRDLRGPSAHHNSVVLQVYAGINNKGKAQNREELLPRSSKLTDEQPDQISQESSNVQQLCASSSNRSTASNEQLVALKNSNNVERDTSPLLPTAEQKRYAQNVAFQLIKTTSPLISDWFLKPTAGHSAGIIPHNATADSATIQQPTPKRLTNTCRFVVNPRTRASAASRYLFKHNY
ncbi:pumilio24 [Dorcoceras hygrometricum]|uniref:Pumilio24 n=1 Tax=Dorcoceras hygrometricum TaxID=472368 RepID=A0A2Z7BSM9_9LAMI|nr:pumilio24 [Dorcoceras hygrometricum]